MPSTKIDTSEKDDELEYLSDECGHAVGDFGRQALKAATMSKGLLFRGRLTYQSTRGR